MNYYKKIAEMLGVELGEEFNLKQNKTKNIIRPRYKITQEEGLMCSTGGEKWNRSSSLLAIFSGAYSIVKLPWKPKEGEAYWYYSETFQHAFASEWIGSLCDLLYWKSGNFFKTKKEANEKGYVLWKELEKEYEEA